MSCQVLTYARLREAVAGKMVAIRRVTELKPAGGDSDKVFPPTYLEDERAVYADEDRLVRDDDGKTRSVKTVLLDSVQSQANRMELALLRGYRLGKLKLPMLEVDFATDEEEAIFREIGKLTVLEMPHRMADAILRDSQFEGVDFRKSLGSCLDEVRTANATPLFELCPTALVFGMWDSTGPKRGLGVKFPRVIVSEIVGFGAEKGVRTAGRIDPLQIENIEGLGMPMYRTGDGGWSFEEAEAALNKKGEPITLKPSDVLHGNIPPSLKNKKGVPHHGGWTISHAVQTTVISLAGLRRLSFPVSGVREPERDLAAQTTLAALALAAVCWQQEEGYDLRSRCWLDGAPGPFEFIGQGQSQQFTLSAEGPAALLEEAVTKALEQDLPWPLEPKTLKPTEKLKKLIRISREKSLAVSVE